jgi:hypothetical protein
MLERCGEMPELDTTPAQFLKITMCKLNPTNTTRKFDYGRAASFAVRYVSYSQGYSCISWIKDPYSDFLKLDRSFMKLAKVYAVVVEIFSYSVTFNEIQKESSMS